MKVELWKATHNKFFRRAILIGLTLTLINVAESAHRVKILTSEVVRYIAADIPVSTSIQGFSLFISWMPVHPSGLGSNIFYFIWPILAAMPYAWSYTQERHSGLYNQIVTRGCKNMYFLSKYFALFVSGGIAIALPVTLDLFLTALVCPTDVPDVTKSLIPLMNISFLSRLYYTRPWIYAVIWCCIEFLWGGVIAVACLMVGSKLRFAAAIILFPFISLVLCDFFLSIICNFFKIKQPFSTMQLARAASTAYNPYWTIPTVLCAMLILTLLMGFWQVKKDELV